MPLPRAASACLDRNAFAGLAAQLARGLGADLLLSGAGWPGEETCLAGLGPLAEHVPNPRNPKPGLRAFLTAHPGPALGFLTYPLGLDLRGVPSAKPRALPPGLFRKYAALLSWRHSDGRLDILGADPALTRELARLAAAPPPLPAWSPPSRAPAAASLDRERYMQAVGQTLEHIRDGDAYQCTMSIRFGRDFPARLGPDLLLRLWLRRPAPFMAWFRHGPLALLSVSPERFLRLDGVRALSQPIKGTASCREDDPALEAALRASPKEDAELSMIVDLMRNDLSQNCAPGSVRVDRHKAVFRVDRLLQMHSDVSGALRPGRDGADLLLDAFPPGSVTGCPKRRALEIMERLEPHCRDIFCGCFAVLRENGDLDASVAIRTAILDARSDRLDFFAGSGIVVDSRPELEYEETVAKADNFLRLEDL
ncbi:MAG: chorismate-binding protein [Desulfovibrio aminophilus]|uniref:chorismate-binding protein n=3 Tax=Desulfovibrio TaxID=872 RepID=UPI0039EC3AB3